jgi:DNA-binding response OmpR family regulator
LQERRRVAADADVPVSQQDRHPAARAGNPAEDIAQHRERSSRLGHPDRVGRDVDAQRRDATLGERYREPAGARSHVERGPVAAVHERLVSGRRVKPLVDRQRHAGAVAVFDLGLHGTGQRRLVKFAKHAVSSQKITRIPACGFRHVVQRRLPLIPRALPEGEQPPPARWPGPTFCRTHHATQEVFMTSSLAEIRFRSSLTCLRTGDGLAPEGGPGGRKASNVKAPPTTEREAAAIMVATVNNPDPPGRIVVVDDDSTVADVVGRYLVRDGHRVECVRDGQEALRRVAAEPPDLVVLDLMLPGIDGLEVCRRLRARWPIPVVMLTALGDETDRLVGFETGADDYVTKPFSPRELALRVRSVLRRARGTGLPETQPEAVIADGDLVVDQTAHEVRVAGSLLSLTSREYDLLVFLLRHPRKAFTREQLLNHVWSWTFGDTSTVTVHVRRLREKLEPDPTLPRRIVTVWGVGYRYEPEAA